MNQQTLQRLAWLGVTAGLCLLVATALAQPVANSAAVIERARVQWTVFAEDAAAAWTDVADQVASLPADPSLADFREVIDPRGFLGQLDPAVASSVRVTIDRQEIGDTVVLEGVTIRFEVPAAWHHLKGEVHFGPDGHSESFQPVWRPLALMLTGAGLAMLIIGALGLAMLRRGPPSE